MADIWIYIVGSVIVGVIAFSIAFNFYLSSINYSENQNMLKKISDFYSTVFSVCLQELNTTQESQITLLTNIRVLYATDDIENPEIKIVDKIKNQNIGSGKNLCMQYKNENELRCFPKESNLACTINMPYMGVLPENEDIWVKVKKILGFPASRDYSLIVQKVKGKEVNVTVIST